ncbi:hypothetical protein [Meiothermus phage MMP17]|nr:hypothetical protein [Meiothermus phage MMP17]
MARSYNSLERPKIGLLGGPGELHQLLAKWGHQARFALQQAGELRRLGVHRAVLQQGLEGLIAPILAAGEVEKALHGRAGGGSHYHTGPGSLEGVHLVMLGL